MSADQLEPEFFPDFESELDIEFTWQDTLQDLFTTTPLAEISNDLRSRWTKLQSQTSGWKERLRIEKDKFIAVKKKEIKKKMNAQKTVRLRDKITFVLGVTFIWTTTLVLARFPNWMSLYYVSTILPLISIRWIYYKSKKWHYFLAFIDPKLGICAML